MAINFQSKTFHWTFHVQTVVGAGLPAIYMLYNNLFDSRLFHRYFVKRSHLDADEHLLKLFEEELSFVSDNRWAPLRNTKISLCVTDKLESSTLGSFGFIYGSMYKLASRLLIRNSDDIRKNFPNLNQIIGIRSPVIDASAVSDDDLKQILLTDDAVRFALCREICRSEGISRIMFPCAATIICYFITIPVLHTLLPIIGAVSAVSVTLALSTVIAYAVLEVYFRFECADADKSAFILYFFLVKNSSNMREFLDKDDKHAKGAEEYFLKSQQLGLLLRRLNGADSSVGKKFTENGDYVSHTLSYSKRLEYLKAYMFKNKSKCDNDCRNRSRYVQIRK